MHVLLCDLNYKGLEVIVWLQLCWAIQEGDELVTL